MKALSAEEAVKDRRQALADSIFAAPAQTLTDAVHKLSVFIEMNEPLDNWRIHLNPGCVDLWIQAGQN
ncbi:hypothetical protein AGR4C_pb20174 [Agrobacterium tumefaciens str. Kerr 14]|uniref:Uncharacterized protein n=1 Tax=Agrobacterium tumefaciens str. Kerr 14 TaxID=1183424 RepID=A0A1S7SFI6_AGRTU|nr:hypothetical protein [Agrobacterium tumefaciens]CUX67618.1 hypothetical protein AGR4C_pb20174 [Agrobacterium tumefaciens str. Kerr 14]